MKKVILILVILASVLGAIRWCIQRGAFTGTPKASAQKADYYYCPMHPWFHQDHPGNCGICGMTLIKKDGVAGDETSGAQAEPGKRKVKFWVNPMDPSVHSDRPMKDSMGMDYAPVYEEEETGGQAGLPESLRGLAAVNLTPFKQQLIGLRTAVVEKEPVVRVIRTVGRFAGGADDFAAAAGDFAAQGTTTSAGGQYIVADVYALDIPYVKVGQKAWVTDFNGSGPRLEGRISFIYPYDGTQSRVRRVRIALSGPPSSELFANVEIEAASQPLLSVPSDAVMNTGLHHYVFVETSAKTFAPREVTVGFQGDDLWQVTSGLNGGETVVDGANFMLDADSKLAANFAAMESQTK